MSQPARRSFQELLSAVPLDARGDLAVLRPVFEEFMLQTPLPSDVSLIEMTLGGVPVLEISVPEASADAALLYFHGGVFAPSSARASAGLGCLLARQARANVLSVDYRLAPEHPYPGATDDALGSYRGLLETGIRPERIVLFGESARGALALGTLVAARDAGLAQPAAAVLYSPWVDLTLSGASMGRRPPWTSCWRGSGSCATFPTTPVAPIRRPPRSVRCSPICAGSHHFSSSAVRTRCCWMT
jgi:acetyl esterase/lipase